MPSNLPPQYYVAEQKYRAARGAAEKVAALQDMLSATPKHKGTDHLRADLRAKVAWAMDDLEQPQRGSSQPQPYAVRKEGAGQAVLLGLPNAGKSRLLATLTGAAAKVADYPFTTRVPLPDMLRYQNVNIQLVDTPAVSDLEVQARLFSLLRNADLLLLVVDLSGDPLSEADQILSELDSYGFQILGEGEDPDPEEHRLQMRALLVANKADTEGATDAFELLEEMHGAKLRIARVSAATGEGLEDLAQTTFSALGKVRVYLRARGSQPDYEEPLILDRGSMVEDAALSVHKDWTRRIRYALLWGSGKFEGQRVGRDYVLMDGDAIELHS